MKEILYKITSIFISNPTDEQLANCFLIVGFIVCLISIPTYFFVVRFLAERNILFRCKSKQMWLHFDVRCDPDNHDNKVCLDCNAEWEYLGEIASQTETTFPVYKRVK